MRSSLLAEVIWYEDGGLYGDDEYDDDGYDDDEYDDDEYNNDEYDDVDSRERRGRGGGGVRQLRLLQEQRWGGHDRGRVGGDLWR